jgi:hypothetical protein
VRQAIAVAILRKKDAAQIVPCNVNEGSVTHVWLICEIYSLRGRLEQKD